LALRSRIRGVRRGSRAPIGRIRSTQQQSVVRQLFASDLRKEVEKMGHIEPGALLTLHGDVARLLTVEYRARGLAPLSGTRPKTVEDYRSDVTLATL
jgi:hypothetical protein